MDIRLKELLHNLKDRNWDVLPTYKIDENEARKIVEALENNGWILCKDRLPKEYQEVIVHTDADETFIANYLGLMNDGVPCFDDDNGMMWEGDVIAWQPLPEWRG